MTRRNAAPDYRKAFEARYDVICHEVDKRRGKWDLRAVDWADARQMILMRVFELFPKYDPARGEFSHWVQTIVTSTIHNIWRKELGKIARPCVANVDNGYKRCAFNAGDDLCSKTASGKQCSECPLYRSWEKRGKKRHHDIKQTLPMEKHSQEVSNVQSDFEDLAGKKRVIDTKMRDRLEPHEWRVWQILMIDGGTEQQAARSLGFSGRKRLGTKMFGGYLPLLKIRNKFRDLVKQIIDEEDL